MEQLVAHGIVQHAAAAQHGCRLKLDAPPFGEPRHPSWFASRVAKAVQVRIDAQLHVRGPRPISPLHHPARLPLRDRQHAAIALRLRGPQRHALAAQPLPRQPARGYPHRRARIVIRQDVAIRAPFLAHLFRSALAEAHAVSRAAALKQDAPAAVLDLVKIAADRVPSQLATHGEAKRAGADPYGFAFASEP